MSHVSTTWEMVRWTPLLSYATSYGLSSAGTPVSYVTAARHPNSFTKEITNFSLYVGLFINCL